MALWVNRTVLSGSSTAANGTNAHTCTFTAATPGNFLVAIMGGAVTFTTPSGWTLATSAVNISGLYIFTKTASAGESSFSTTHNGSNYEIKGVVYEFYAGTTVTGTAGSATGLGLNQTATGPNCTSLTGTYTRFAVRSLCLSSGSDTASNSWTLPTTSDLDAYVPKGSQDGIWLGISYDDNATGSSFTPSGYLTTTNGLTMEGVSFALSVVPQPPIVSLANYNESGGAAASQTTGTIYIPANSVVLVFANGSKEVTAANWGTATISVSDSINGTSGWTGLDSLSYHTGSVYDGGGQAFYRSFTSSTSLTITVSRSVDTAYWGYSVVAVTGHITANPIVQAKGTMTQWDDGGNSHAQSVTLSSSPTSGNMVVWFLGVNNDSPGAATIPAGYTSLDNPSAVFQATNVAYNSSTTSAAINCTDCGDAIEYAVAVAVEVRFIAATSTIPVFWLKA